MNPDFISVVETAFAQESRFWYLLFYDEEAVPVACTSAFTFNVDVVTLAGARLKKIVQAVRGYLPGWATMKVLFCGLPVSLGQNHLAIKPDSDREQILQLLDMVLATDLVPREKARLIVYKEFDAIACHALKPLAAAGYCRAECPASYVFQAEYKDFSDYCAALNSHYRNDIRRSQRKFERAGLSAEHLRDPAKILHLYDHSVHRLYEAVVEKSDVKLERLPIEFFRGLARQFPGQVSLTVIRRENHVVAFNWGLHDRSAFHFLFCGIDYSENSDADLYFNVMYQQLDYALDCGPEHVNIGQTADSFKLRLGCRPRPLYFYVRGVGPLLSTLVRRFARVLFPKRPVFADYSVFKRESASLLEQKVKPGQPERSGIGRS